MIVRVARLLYRADRIIREQNMLIEHLRSELATTELAYMRIGRDLMEQFVIALDQPENHDEIRNRLIQGLGFYRDEIAIREEHI